MALVDVTRWLAAIAAGVTAVTGCATGSSTQSQASYVVASTDVWSSIAGAVAGSHIRVKYILSSSAVDPHTYTASPADATAIKDAALVIFNGGGYDGWVDDVLERHPKIKPVDAFSFLPNGGDEHEPNAHVVYDLAVARSVATTIADRLATIDPANGKDYRANAAAFCREADTIADSEHSIATKFPNTAVVATEPVAYYLLQAAGLDNLATPAVIKARDDGNDPLPADMNSVLDSINRRQASAVLINPQASSPGIVGLQDAARRVGVPVVDVTEALPAGTDYLTWQRNTADQLVAALQSSPSNARR